MSLGFCGYGLYTNYLAAEIAIERISGLAELSFKNTTKISNLIQDLSAILYGLGLTLLVSTSLFKIKKLLTKMSNRHYSGFDYVRIHPALPGVAGRNC